MKIMKMMGMTGKVSIVIKWEIAHIISIMMGKTMPIIAWTMASLTMKHSQVRTIMTYFCHPRNKLVI